MKIETLKLNKRKYFLYGLIMGVALLLPLVLSITFGKYQTRESIKLAEGTISYKPYDFKIMAMYQENDNGNYEETETMPTGNYKINEEQSYCTLDNINKDNNAILKTNENGEHIINNLSKNDKCYLYFDKKVPTASEVILATKTISTRTDFSTILTTDTTGTVYSAEDNYGTSYYFAGAPTDNWVQFAGFYWRIIRINGDGTIRMIYQGESANTTGEGTQIGTSSYNNSYNSAEYTGFMYTIGEVNGHSTPSEIMQYLNKWFESNFNNNNQYLISETSGFCESSTPSTVTSTVNGQGGTGTTATHYDTRYRIIEIKNPTLKCSNHDLYTPKNSKSGNKALIYPIGLITADEVMYAGATWATTNNNFYLNNSLNYWIMGRISASYYNDGTTIRNFTSTVFTMISGKLGSYPVDFIYGVRPVINLKYDITFSSGNGTIDNPYIVS